MPLFLLITLPMIKTGSTIRNEIFCGVIHFFACMYVVPGNRMTSMAFNLSFCNYFFLFLLFRINFWSHLSYFMPMFCLILSIWLTLSLNLMISLPILTPHFHSCTYPVIPHQMSKAGYNLINTATVCSAMSALACFCSAFLTNLPFVVSPPAAVSVFLAVYLRTQNLKPHIGNVAVVYSGVGMTILGCLRPLTVIFYKVWQYSTKLMFFFICPSPCW